MSKKLVLYIFVSLSFSMRCAETSLKWPTVGISILVRNKAHTLPYFLSCLLNLDYPKDRIYVWMYTDLNEDNTLAIIEEWATNYSSVYNRVYIKSNHSLNLGQTKSISNWSLEHFQHVIKLREEALTLAREMWADYIFMIDADVFLTEPSTLKLLVNKNESIVSPMLLSDGLYSNFWCGMTENYYYKRTDEYKPILKRKNIGCHDVPMVHTAVLISLKYIQSDMLTYVPQKIKGYDGPEDDIIAFAINARNQGISLRICNDNVYGYVTIPSELKDDPEQLLNIKLEALSRGTPIPLKSDLAKYIHYPELMKFGCDQIFMINLERREKRRRLMQLSFKEIGIDATLFNAVDGRNLNIDDLSEFSVTLMPNYEDPYHRRPMKAGEIGCFLSHYTIWQKILENRYSITLVLEDDIHFVPYFRQKFAQLMDEIKDLNWDLVYIGRKILLSDEEEFVTQHTTRPMYSYWTLGYLLSEVGAKKLLAADPLTKMLPVDEFLPIMFNQHPNDTWKSYFPIRNLNAFSAAPLLVHPTHYTGEEGYISDTEDSTILHVQTADVRNEL